MVRERGFTLVEIILVLAIIGTLLAIASFSWNQMSLKSGIESQIKKLQADLMEIRLQALYSKTPRSIIISGTEMKIYSSDDTTISPILTKHLPYSVTWSGGDSSPLTFNAQGIVRELTPETKRCICIVPNGDTSIINEAAVDSVVVSQITLNLGKRTGGECTSGNIKQQ